MTRHNRNHGHPLHPGLAPDVMTVLPLDPARSERESEVDSVRLSLTIIQFTAHVIHTQQQQAHVRKPHKKPWGDGRAAKQVRKQWKL